ncbi:MAG: DUF1178 family protein [Pseudomonadota bacterium]
MIRYTLKCGQNHTFESWFASADAYESLRAGGHVSCAICGDTDIEKSLMAPAVAPKGDVTSPSLATAHSPQEEAFQKFKEHVEANTTDVGRDFAKRARAMHDGTEPDAPIRGEANLGEVKGLLENGVPVAPLPFSSNRRTN